MIWTGTSSTSAKSCSRTSKMLRRGTHRVYDILSRSVAPIQYNRPGMRFFGQPAAQTHPHLLQEGEVTPGITIAEYQQRRNKLIERVVQHMQPKQCEKHILIIPSAVKMIMSNDIPYPFRQNTDFLYLCGFQEPSSVLIIESSKSMNDCKSTLFVPMRDPSMELWEGARSGVDGSVVLTGVDEAYNTDELGRYLRKYSANNSDYLTWYDAHKPAHVEYHFSYFTEFLKGRQVESPRSIIHSLRWIKSPAEIALMQKSCNIAGKALEDTMHFSHPGVNEAHLQAKMDFECRLQNAEYLAYPPVVAGGNRANTIHYINNNQIVEDGDMVLMDAGCEYHGYASDITRTWPVSGTFTTAQRELYEALLEVNERCIAMATVDNSVEAVFTEMLQLLGQQLQRLGVIPSTILPEERHRYARSFCPHHVSHYLGMDVHDTDSMPRNVNLKPGMVITVEPGIYIPNSKTGVAAELRGMGIRIEDNILITEEGPHILTSSCPKQSDHLEAVVQGS